MSKHKLLSILIIAVCAVVIIVHWPALSTKALLFDDNAYVFENELTRNPGWASVSRFVSEVLEPSTVPGYYQPLTMISLMFDYAMGGRADNLAPFHRTSLALHTANTALVIILLYLLFGNSWIAAAVGLIFGVHPMTVETVSWISERKTLLASFFSIVSLIFYVHYAHAAVVSEEFLSHAGKGKIRRLSKKNSVTSLAKNRRDFWLCFIFYFLALMSKPTSTPLPILMLLLDFWPLKRLKPSSVFEKIPLFVLGVIFVIITYISQAKIAGTLLPGEAGIWRIILIVCHNITFYLYKIVWPVNLSSYYPFPEPFNLSNPRVLAGVIGTCILIPLLIISVRRTRAAITGWLSFFVMIFPTLGIIGFTYTIGCDKFVYLPSIGLLMILASLLIWFCTNSKIGKPAIRYAAVTVFILTAASAESFVLRNYLVHWRTSSSLYEYMLSSAPHSPMLYNGLGAALSSQGRFDEALSQYRKAIDIQSRIFDAYQNSSNSSVSQGKTDEAISRRRKLFEVAPHYAVSYINMGIILKSQGKSDEAVNCFRKALEIQPDNAKAHFNLGMALQEQGKPQEAAAHFHNTFAANLSNAEIQYNLGVLSQSQGKPDEAANYFLKAVQLKPDYAEAHNNLGLLLAQKGRLDEAIGHFRKALQINPDYMRAQLNLAIALLQQGKFDEALHLYHLILQRDPNNAEVHFNYGIALQSQNKIDEALNSFCQAMILKPAWPLPLNEIAQILVFSSDPKICNPKEAIKLSNRACELTNNQNAQFLGTLAAAYAGDGQFDLAVKIAQNALRIAERDKNFELSESIRRQLEFYRQAQHQSSSQP